MRLSDYNKIFFQVVKDCEFETLAKSNDDVDSFFVCYIEDEKYIKAVEQCNNVVGVICSKEFAEKNNKFIQKVEGYAISSKPKTSFFLLHNYLAENENNYIHDKKTETFIDPTAIISESAYISPVGVKIGKNVIVENNVVINSGAEIGDNCLIRSNAIVGGTDENVFFDFDGNLTSIIAAGKTRLANNVVVGSGTMIGNGIFPTETTILEQFVKVGYGVEIAHHAYIGEQSLILGQAQICGNAIIGRHVRVGPQAIVSNRIVVRDNAVVTIGATVISNVKEGATVAGNWAIDKDMFLLWHMKKLKIKGRL